MVRSTYLSLQDLRILATQCFLKLKIDHNTTIDILNIAQFHLGYATEELEDDSDQNKAFKMPISSNEITLQFLALFLSPCFKMT